MCDIDVVKLRRIAFDFLGSFKDLTNVSTRQLRRHCEEVLKFPADTLTGVEEKEILATIVQEFAEGHMGKQVEEDDASVESEKSEESLDRLKSQHRRFTAAESDTIMKYLKEYMARNNFIMEEVCATMRDGSDKKRVHHTCWKELQAIMKNRTHYSIRMHAERRMIHECADQRGWTDESKKELMSLAEINGSDWCTTGRTMGKMSSECRNMFLKLTNKRVNTGLFSREEDAALLAAIKKARGYKRDHPVEDIPDKGNPWTEIARLMKNKRQPLDYLKRWPVLKGWLIKGGPDGPSACPTKTMKGMIREELSMPWLEAIFKRGANAADGTEVVWADIDKELLLAHGQSAHRWVYITKRMNPDWTFRDKLDHLMHMGREYGRMIKVKPEKKAIVRRGKGEKEEKNEKSPFKKPRAPANRKSKGSDSDDDDEEGDWNERDNRDDDNDDISGDSDTSDHNDNNNNDDGYESENGWLAAPKGNVKAKTMAPPSKRTLKPLPQSPAEKEKAVSAEKVTADKVSKAKPPDIKGAVQATSTAASKKESVESRKRQGAVETHTLPLTPAKRVMRSRNEEVSVEEKVPDVTSKVMSEKRLLALEREYKGSVRCMSEMDDNAEKEEEIIVSNKGGKALKKREKEEEVRKQKRLQAFNELVAFQRSCVDTPATNELKRARKAEEDERREREERGSEMKLARSIDSDADSDTDNSDIVYTKTVKAANINEGEAVRATDRKKRVAAEKIKIQKEKEREKQESVKLAKKQEKKDKKDEETKQKELQNLDREYRRREKERKEFDDNLQKELQIEMARKELEIERRKEIERKELELEKERKKVEKEKEKAKEKERKKAEKEMEKERIELEKEKERKKVEKDKEKEKKKVERERERERERQMEKEKEREELEKRRVEQSEEEDRARDELARSERKKAKRARRVEEGIELEREKHSTLTDVSRIAGEGSVPQSSDRKSKKSKRSREEDSPAAPNSATHTHTNTAVDQFIEGDSSDDAQHSTELLEKLLRKANREERRERKRKRKELKEAMNTF